MKGSIDFCQLSQNFHCFFLQCTQQTQRTTWPNGYAHVSDNPPPCPSGMATISARRLIYASSQTVNTSFIYGHSRVTRRCTGLASASVLTACLAVLLPRCGHLNGSVFNILRIRHAVHTHTHTSGQVYRYTCIYVYIWYIAICMACLMRLQLRPMAKVTRNDCSKGKGNQ